MDNVAQSLSGETQLMEQIEPFISLTALRSNHRKLLERRGKDGQTTDFLDEVEIFVQRGVATGVLLDARSDRWQAQNLIDYWGNELYHARRKAAETTLEAYDPTLAPELDDSLCPYIGLQTFGVTQHALFFGRNALIDEMVEKLKYSRFLAIVGPSGSGKSSVAQAGLVPRLKEGALHGSKSWRYYPPVIPGSDPQASLAHILKPKDIDSEEWMEAVRIRSEADSTHLVNLIDQGGPDPAVLVIDQFEELFTVCDDEQKRRAFILTLLNLIQMPKTRHTVIITMRADIESQLVQIPALQSEYEKAQVRVTAMKANEMREVIENPAELVGLKFEEDLVDEMIGEVLGKSAALPLLQFTLLKLWEKRDHNRVTWEAYRQIGGGQDALANSADASYDSLSPEGQEVAKKIFLGIVRPTVERRITADRILKSNLYQELDVPLEKFERILAKLQDARLLRSIPGTTPENDQVGLAHESLARIWPRFIGWIEESRVAQRQRLRLATTAEQWQAIGRPDSLLLRGLLLEEALQYEDLNALEQAFIDASSTAVHKEQAEKDAVRQRELEQARALAEAERERAEESAQSAKRLARLAVALLIVFVLAMVAAFWAARNGAIAQQNEMVAANNARIAEELRIEAEKSAETAVSAQEAAMADADLRATAEAEAQEQRDVAEANAEEAEHVRATAVASAAESEANARLATARELAAAGVDQLNSDPQLGLLLAIEAVNRTLPVDNMVAAEAEESLYRALQTSQLQMTLSGHTDWLTDVAISDDGKFLATTGYDNSVKLWDAETGQELQTFNDHSRVVNGVAFSPNGQRLASVSDDGFVIVYDLKTGERIAVMNGNDGAIRAVTFSPDNVTIAAANGDGTVRVWDTDARRSIYRLFGHGAPVKDVDFNFDGSLLASAGEDGRSIIWDMETGGPVYSVDPSDDPDDTLEATGISFSPDGQRIITAYDDGVSRVWDYENEGLLFNLIGHASTVFDAAYSPDGKLMATSSGDGTTKVWDAETGQALYTLSGHNGPVTAVTFSPDSARIATASQDTTAKLWNSEAGLDVLILSRHRQPLNSIAFNDDGSLVVTASDDRTAKVWDSVTGDVILNLGTHSQPVNSAAFSPDGQIIVTTSDDFNARLWNLDVGDIRLPILSHDAPVNWAAFDSDGARLVTASNDGRVSQWNALTGDLLQTFTHETAVNTAVYSPDSKWLAVADAHGNAVIWDASTGEEITRLTGHEGPVNHLVFSDDGRRLVTAGGDGTAKLWDISSGEILRNFTGHTGPVTSVAISPDGTRLATASVDRTVKLWNTETGQVLRTLLGHTASVHSVVFSPDGTRLATASADRTAQINDLNPVTDLFERALERITRPLSTAECEQYLRGETCLTTEE
jgi:WD40 repeat protein/RecA/RadA recombinase